MRQCVWALALVLGAGSVTAHHSTAMFDIEREVNLQGVVAGFAGATNHQHDDKHVSVSKTPSPSSRAPISTHESRQTAQK